MRVFLDTNVLASALATRGLCAELFETVLVEHELVTSRELLLELKRILPAKFCIPASVMREFIALINEVGNLAAGGPVFNGGTAQVTGSRLTGNRAENGGGFYTVGEVTLTDSTVSKNTADTGGGFEVGSGTPAIGPYGQRAGSVTLTRTTISDNRARQGGGIRNVGRVVGVETTTVSQHIEQLSRIVGVVADIILLSLGQDGLLVGTEANVGHLTAPDQRFTLPGSNAINTVGCGDALVGGFCHQYVRSENVLESACWGIACATVTLGNYGVPSCPVDQVSALVEDIGVIAVAPKS